jgi:hypothetical protein
MMTKEQVKIRVDAGNTAEVEMLQGTLARVVAPLWSAAISVDDIVRLNHEPSEGGAMPELVEVIFKRNPVISDVRFMGPWERDRLIALATVLGAEVLDVEETTDAIPWPATIRIAHAEDIDFLALAEAAGISSDFGDEDEEDGEDEEQGSSDEDAQDPQA